MEIEKAKTILLKKLKEQKLRGWTVGVSNAVHTIGICIFKDKLIKISKVYCETASDEDIYDTICHEVAHAIIGYNNGDIHCEKWRKKCIELGGTGKIFSEEEIPFRYKAVCGSCGIVSKSHKFMRNLSCRICDPEFNEKYILEFQEYNQYELAL